MTATRSLILQLKDEEQDFEWYPTTNDIIDEVAKRIPDKVSSIMDIGAGDGRVLKSLGERFKEIRLYAIEKAPLLIKEQPKNIIPVGTELFEQSLSSIQVDYIFCNPTYSNYEDWIAKIVEEGYCKKAFVVVPNRWDSSNIIKQALKDRGAETKVIYETDFRNADRQARAIVDVVEITFPENRYGNIKNPFDIWFDNNIVLLDKSKEIEEEVEDQDALARRLGAMGIEELVAEYLTERQKLEDAYRSIFKIDMSLLRRVGVDKEKVRETLKLEIKGLKVKYWKHLFTRTDAITSRLTTKSKIALLDKLNWNLEIEFTATNAYTIIMWAIKNANAYFETQAIELFYAMTSFEGMLQYKSNQRVWQNNDWRYKRDWREAWYNRSLRDYHLDYRLIVSKYRAIGNRKDYSYDYPANLHNICHELLDDIIAVMANLGFNTYSPNSRDRMWRSNKKEQWFLAGKQGVVLFQARAFINGNMHFHFKPEAIQALNVYVARALKWVNSVEDVVREMDYPVDVATKFFNNRPQIEIINVPLLKGSNAE